MTNFEVIKTLTAEQYTTIMSEINYKRGMSGPRDFIDWLNSELDERFWFYYCAIIRLDKEKYCGQKS